MGKRKAIAASPAMIDAWRRRLDALAAKIQHDPSAEWAWLWRLRGRILL